MFSLLLVAPVRAEITVLPWNTTTGISFSTDTSFNTQDDYAAVGTPDGSTIVTWRLSGSPNVVKAQKFAPDGTIQWGAAGLTISTDNPPTTNPGDEPKLVSDGENGAIIFWTSAVDPLIYAQRVLADGTLDWENELTMNVTEGYDTVVQEKVKVISDGFGGAVVTWKEMHTGEGITEPYVVAAQRIDEDGNRLWNENAIEIFSSANNDRQAPSIEKDNDNYFYIGWTDYPNDRGKLQKLDVDGNIFWSAGGVAAIEHDIQNVFVVPDNHGGAYITCTYCYHYGHVDADGNSLSPTGVEMDVVGMTRLHGTSDRLKNVFTDRDGNFVYVASNVDDEISVVKYDSEGNEIWGRAEHTFPTPNFGMSISGAVTDENTLLVTWFSNAQHHMQKVDLETGSTLWDTNLVASTDLYAAYFTRVSAGNWRIFGKQMMGPSAFMQALQWYFQIDGLDNGLDAENSSFENIETDGDAGIIGSNNQVYIREENGPYLAIVTVDAERDLSWTEITGTTDPDTGVTVIGGISDSEGVVDETYTILIPKDEDDSSVVICPGVQNPEDITGTCENGTEYGEDSPGVSIIVIDEQEYWAIEDVEGDVGGGSNLTIPDDNDGEENQNENGNNSGQESGKSSRSSARQSRSSGKCHTLSPAGAPDLFEIRVTSTTAQLFFSPLSDIDTYAITYGLQPGANDYAVTFPSSKTGVGSFTINDLTPNQTYFFKVHGLRGCAPSKWSNTMEIVTPTPTGANKTYYAYGPMIKAIAKQVGTSLKNITNKENSPSTSASPQPTNDPTQLPRPSSPPVQSPTPSPVPSPQPPAAEQQSWWQTVRSWLPF